MVRRGALGGDLAAELVGATSPGGEERGQSPGPTRAPGPLDDDAWALRDRRLWAARSDAAPRPRAPATHPVRRRSGVIRFDGPPLLPLSRGPHHAGLLRFCGSALLRLRGAPQ